MQAECNSHITEGCFTTSYCYNKEHKRKLPVSGVKETAQTENVTTLSLTSLRILLSR